MCGITGRYNLDKNFSSSNIEERLDLMKHRGPDDEGYIFINAEKREVKEFSGHRSMPYFKEKLTHISACNSSDFNIELAQTRLSIIDLTEKGHQPMPNNDGSIWLVFNGEIYNYLELLEELKAKGHQFTSRSDSEVLIHAYQEWGTDCLKKFNGMFAFALWDQNKKQLFCARDRFGIKPFYYCFENESFEFSSEIKPLLLNKKERNQPNEKVIIRYLALSERNTNHETFFTPVYQLLPAHYMIISSSGIHVDKYWELPENTNWSISESEATEQFEKLFHQAVQRHLRSDIPVGSCLSGGVDSSAIVGSVYNIEKKKETGFSFHTFSSCFEDKRFDERIYIDEVVKNKHELKKHLCFPNPKDFLSDYEKLLWHQEEPFGSLSIYAQWSVMKLARENGITVLLDGQGADELLAGYNTFRQPYLNELFGNFAFGRYLKELRITAQQLALPKSALFRKTLRNKLPLVNKLKQPALTESKGIIHPDLQHHINKANLKIESSLNNYSKAELSVKHLQALLHYEDRNSMAFSIESRVPFLDKDLVEFTFSLPASLKIRNGITKYVMRKGLKNTIPSKILSRTDKMGFVTPGENVWLKNELKEFTREALQDTLSGEISQYLNIGNTEQLVDKYFSNEGKGNKMLIWRLINIGLWKKGF